MDSVIIREMREEDLPALYAITSQAWNYEKYGYEKELREAFAALEFDVMRAFSNYFSVAEVDGKPAGYLMGRIEKDFSEEDFSRAEARCDELMEGTKRFDLSPAMQADEETYTRIDQELKKASGGAFDAEVTYFALSEEARGKGTGKALIGQFLRKALEEGASRYYLITDTTCNYPFYEKIGMQRKAETREAMQMRKGEEIDIFLYDGQTKDILARLKESQR